MPWTQWRHVRHSFYDCNGNHYYTEPEKRGRWDSPGYKAILAAEEACPKMAFLFKDFDGELLSVDTKIEEREWRFGTGWFKWLCAFRRNKLHRSLDLRFSGETGKRKGSWKGGTTGHSIEMQPGELHESAFRRYCDEHDMSFVEQ